MCSGQILLYGLHESAGHEQGRRNAVRIGFFPGPVEEKAFPVHPGQGGFPLPEQDSGFFPRLHGTDGGDEQAAPVQPVSQRMPFRRDSAVRWFAAGCKYDGRFSGGTGIFRFSLQQEEVGI